MAAVTEDVTYERRLALLTTRANGALRERLVATEDSSSVRPADESRLAFSGDCTSLAGIMERDGVEAFGFSSRDELTERLKQYVRPGDLVFFKGSHSFSLERVAAQL